MRKLTHFFVMLALLSGLGAPLFADARNDVRVGSSRDREGHTTYSLINTGDSRVEVTVEFTKVCGSRSNDRAPQVRTFHVQPGGETKLERVAARSSCKHSHRIVKVEAR